MRSNEAMDMFAQVGKCFLHACPLYLASEWYCSKEAIIGQQNLKH